LSYLLHIKL